MISYGTYEFDEYVISYVFSELGIEKIIPGERFDWDIKRFPEFEELLEMYFQGREADFMSIPMNFSGTEFQLRVWENTRKIKSGEVMTYQDIAYEIGVPKCSRAVGNALSENPIPIAIPCHRVISKSGLGGYRYGLEWKKKLLSVEGFDIKSFTK